MLECLGMQAQADLNSELGRVRQEAAGERARLEAEARQAKEDGSMRIRSLEDSLARLSGRGGEPQVEPPVGMSKGEYTCSATHQVLVQSTVWGSVVLGPPEHCGSVRS
jgi:hypothetical protein